MEIEFAMKFTDDPKNAQRFNELLKFENKIKVNLNGDELYKIKIK